MFKLCELLRKDPKKGCLFGVEVEIEGKNLGVPNQAVWKSIHDGSLRGVFPHGCAEHVFAKPLPYDASVKAIDHLIATMDKPETEVNFSFRTSVHVHTNVMDLERDQILSIIYTYLLLEEPLINFCGEGRKANRFCLRLRDAEGFLDFLVQAFRTNEWWRSEGNAYRYASINIESLKKYGTLEFRGMRGTLERDVLVNWLRILDAVRTYGLKNNNPKDIHKKFMEIGPRAFMVEVLGEELAGILVYPGIDMDMAMSLSLSLDLPFAFKSQKELGEVAQGKKAKYKARLEVPGGMIDMEGVQAAAAPDPIVRAWAMGEAHARARILVDWERNRNELVEDEEE